MEKYSNQYNSLFCRFVSFILFGFVSVSSFAQEERDTVKGYNKGILELPNPNSVVEAYTYDPLTDRYIYSKTFEGYNIDYPIVLTPEEYRKLIQKEAIRDYFKKKSDAVSGKKEGSKDAKKDLLPRYYVNSSFFESVFGGNTIDVKPTGTVEIDLGMRYSKQDNPSFSPRNRSSFTFDFDQRISLSLMGQVGTKLKVNANYDTESTFAFQNLIKLEYTPTEDDILRKIEVGNVSMPLNSTLIRGAQSLFGVKTQLQFGKTTVTGVFSEQKSQTRSVTSQGGGLLQEFDLFGLDYDADRHFFLSQYFRNKYDKALANYPIIDSRVQITRMEVWVTNRQNRVTANRDGNNLRNIVALQDLGEAQLTGLADSEVVSTTPLPGFFNQPPDSPTANNNNGFDPQKIGSVDSNLTSAIRDVSTAGLGFKNLASDPVEGVDYSKLENARKLTPSEYTFHPQLGYISLNQRLTNDEVLAVAYQYTIGGEVYQVGEFGTDGVDATQVDTNNIPSSQALILKMLKGNLTNVNKPVWNLMMKNIYQIPGAYQLDQNDFKLNILYTDPSPVNYISSVSGYSFPSNPTIDNEVEKTPLLRVFNMDRLNPTNDPQTRGDGFFDFIPGLTVDPQNARIIFTTVEPFGKLLFDKLKDTNTIQDYNDETTYNPNQKKYVFRNLYKKTQALALQDSDKNKFQLKGRFKSSTGQGISLGATNVPRGSVVVTAGGRVLQEGIDYSVNYQSGRVEILDPALQASGVPINVSVENNAVFGQQTRRFVGVNVEHKFSDKFQLGGTILNMSERPFTQKTNYGQESVNNTIFGLNTTFSTEVPFFTRLVNKLPNIDTDVPSNLSFRGEVAFLKPGTPKADRFQGESTVYVDDFEGSQSTIDMKAPLAWTLSSVPDEFQDKASGDVLGYGYKRAKFSWYTIDPIFYTVQRPAGLSDNDISRYDTRRIYSRELYPQTDIAAGQTTVITTLDLTYYPKERGPYNYNPSSVNNLLSNPQENFGGIMRPITSTNFEQANVEYIQFWVQDPYYETGSAASPTNTGKVSIHLGEISEDVLKDNKKVYENGLPIPGSNQAVYETDWGKVPASQSLIYAFDTDPGNRKQQDVGLNGLNDAEEAAKHPNFASDPDPSQDNYEYFLSASGSITDRYKRYNGNEGNSPVEVTDTNRGSVTTPDVEDINRDNTMNTIEAYYKFDVDIKPNMKVGDLYVTDVREGVETMANGNTVPTRWIQFKIPIDENGPKYGEISDLRSIRFMRMLMHGFNDKITLRFGSLDLVRGEFRKYLSSLQPNVDGNNDDDPTGFDVQGVNIEENTNRRPVRYVTPPGVEREQLNNNNTIINQNEQSLSLRVYDKDNAQSGTKGLEGGDSRATFKNVNVDMRQYKKLKMFLHAEALPSDVTNSNSDVLSSLRQKKMYGFLRFGNDFTNNFYQVEIPLKITEFGQGEVTGTSQPISDPSLIWPEENQIDLQLSLLSKIKSESLKADPSNPNFDENGIYYIEADGLRIGIKGNPNIGFVRTMMLGVKNANNNPNDYVRGEVWFNELRLADMNSEGGMAAIASLDTNLADFMTLSATGRMNTIGFGGIEQSPNERSREDAKIYDIVTNVNLGKLLPKKWGINLPMNYAVGEQIITPEYDPLYQDLKLKDVLNTTTSAQEKEAIKKRAEDFTKRQSISFIGVRKERGPDQKQHFYDPENLTLSYSFSQMEHRNFEIEGLLDQQVRTSADYNYSFKPKPVEPFKNTKFMKKSSYWKLLSDFNFNYLPTNVNFSSSILRQFNKQEFRDVDNVQGIGLQPLFKRNFLFNYNYGFNFNLTKSLRLNYTATTGNIVRNYLDEMNQQDPEFTIWDDYWNIGMPNQHNQQLTVNYELPVAKIPFLAFVKSDYTYTGDYSWSRASFQAQDFNGYNLGNTIQNANSHKLNTSFTMSTFYKYIGLVKSSERVKKPKAATTPVASPKPGEKIVAKPKEKEVKPNIWLDGLIGVVTSVKNVQINYTETNGTMLPGYLPSIGFLGSSRPSLGFVFGMQDDVRFEAAKRGWLTNYPEFNQNFTQINNKQITATANMELFPDLKIDLSADRTMAENFSEQFDAVGGVYNSRSPYSFGNFSISTNMIRTAFSQSDENYSEAFEQFRNNRLKVAERLATQHYGSNSFSRYGDAAYPIPTDTNDPNYAFYLANQGYPVGFGKNNQAVLLPAFMAAYTGGNASGVSLDAFRNIPIPNWTLRYTGLMRYKFFKDKFKRFSIQHGYKAAYTLNSFRSNFEYDKDPGGQQNDTWNFFNKTIIANVNLTEQFSPLIRLDFEMKNSVKILAEMKKDRTLSLSFDNNLLTEMRGFEYIFGFGYRIKDVKIKSSLADNPTGVVKSDINLRADFSYRNNKTIVRNIDYNNNQLGGGQNLISAKLTGDYNFNKNLTTAFYFDYSFSKAVISTAFPLTNVRSGFTLRYNFGN